MRARPFLLPLALLALSFTAATAYAKPPGICDMDSPIGPGEVVSGGSSWINQFFSEGSKPQAFAGAVNSGDSGGDCQIASENPSVAQRTEQRNRRLEIN